MNKGQRASQPAGGSSCASAASAPLFQMPRDFSWAERFPKAIPEGMQVWARDVYAKPGPLWKRAKIIFARNRSESKGILNSSSPTEYGYDYYIHWIGRDRRLDCWVGEESIRQHEPEMLPGEMVERVPPAEHDSDHEGLDEAYLTEHNENTKLKTINKMCMGRHVVDCWYFSPFPVEYQNKEVLYVCEFCLAFFGEKEELLRHGKGCSLRHPPGDEIYREGNISMFEVDGTYSRIYCENLCYIAKLFLDHKTLKHQVGLFIFYVLTEYDELGYHIVGYFSKEKYSKNNLSCILTLPQHQRKGYGKFLISFSYELSKKEKLLADQTAENGLKRSIGGPERPFSDLGRASYMAWWTPRLLTELQRRVKLARVAREAREAKLQRQHTGGGGSVRDDVPTISIKALSEAVSISQEDVFDCLCRLGVLREYDGEMVFFIPEDYVNGLLKQCGKEFLSVNPDKIHWAPYEHFMAPFEFNPNA
mmetsp:Transcript_52706/g.132498  ORF Transcript_52706/g.132498 Transcript_52706/m.132498 type:complete len:476 (-) Transcript_52706:238-1665(-)